jgi:hypothetical protein
MSNRDLPREEPRESGGGDAGEAVAHRRCARVGGS